MMQSGVLRDAICDIVNKGPFEMGFGRRRIEFFDTCKLAPLFLAALHSREVAADLVKAQCATEVAALT